MKLCPAILKPPHPRAGKPCGRRYMTGEGCENHRPPKPEVHTKPRGDTLERQQRRRIAKRAAGIPAGWDV
jgi:hypothetical protein